MRDEPITERLDRLAEGGMGTISLACRDARAEIERLRLQVQDAELALRVWDAAEASEYWLRHPPKAYEQLTQPKEG